MLKTLQIKDFLAQQPERVVLDVRTPAEFEHAHLPGAENLPLFSNEERAEVGTLYKQVSPEKAFLRGLDMAGAKMSWYVKEAYRLAPGRKVAVHCWRGGKRSSSMATLLAFSGFDVCVLKGGYKAYRNYVLEEFAQRKTRFVVIGGKTGSGKTEILKQMQALGEQVIDLEGLANHKGSAFGALGQGPQPGVEQFENNLFREFDRIDPGRRVWVENESRSIGRVFVPQGFYDQMKAAPLMRLEVPFEERTRFLIEGYGAFHPVELKDCLLKIEKRMGGLNVKTALEAFQNGDLKTATEIALRYYDKTYTHATGMGNFCKILDVEVDEIDPPAAANRLIKLADEHKL